tara:strand:+ start:70 stop:243 length:174 start_codon:yes stop_codon:yes gene_type:complete
MEYPDPAVVMVFNMGVPANYPGMHSISTVSGTVRGKKRRTFLISHDAAARRGQDPAV